VGEASLRRRTPSSLLDRRDGERVAGPHDQKVQLIPYSQASDDSISTIEEFS